MTKPKSKEAAGAKKRALSHLSAEGEIKMVDISAKPVSVRVATAGGRIRLRAETVRLIAANRVAKGNVLAAARIAGIQAAKETSRLIPLCHTLNLSDVEVGFRMERNGIGITCTVRATARTGAEMEALTGVALAALTIYDMCKAVDKEMEIGPIRLLRKEKRAVERGEK